MTDIHISPIAVVSNTRMKPTDDEWGGLMSEIRGRRFDIRPLTSDI